MISCAKQNTIIIIMIIKENIEADQEKNMSTVLLCLMSKYKKNRDDKKKLK